MTATDRLRDLLQDKYADRIAEWERAGAFPDDVASGLADTGVLGAMVPAEHGGTAWSHRAYGEANRLVAQHSCGLQSLLTVHGMVTSALNRSGSVPMRAELAELAAAGTVAAFALTEAAAGSDVRALRAAAEPAPDGWRLTGTKRWVSFGQIAGLFLVFANTPDGDAAFAVRRDDPGVRITPEAVTAGFRASRLAILDLDGCEVGPERLVGRPGFGLTQVGGRALVLGRMCVAFGSVGLAETALNAALARLDQPGPTGRRLRDHQLLRGLVADAVVAARGARLLAESAADALDARAEWAVSETLAAKLAASRAATVAAGVSAQIHGAEGLVEDGPVHRRVCDARVMEVIEGNTQLVQDLLADQVLARWRAESRPGDRRSR
ncbi:acyl-CoA/acyl-ACP dehydrogenase [Catenulispora sp. NF23]|uniref:Acyl-CoA/acyl-ACP dehydrogenase n=1 Tax=Catenulispora pinistramenti TaxID=2705254 RepID=A0ABS5KR98_9ACTN|nr:acyl-CoA dehydrogenase family protein [Catenulispora pinistramenti]MBS2533106.1 acyl-CoA/acyl-ACP dehydrogenase [Catenulispora pinistramenti]MBS2548567.1 acyl-CoA/acyl-ACP dehydrogenase [Catenulispora pinistramenti]